VSRAKNRTNRNALPGQEIRTPTDAATCEIFDNSARYYESVNMVISVGQ
jgi:hypothetical protein